MFETQLDVQDELDLNAKFSDQRQRVHDCLCDSVDTRGTMEAVRELISAANVYINRKNTQRSTPNVVLVRNIALYVTRLMRTFGVVTTNASGGGDDEEIGFGAELTMVNGGDAENGNFSAHLYRFLFGKSYCWVKLQPTSLNLNH